MAIPVKERLIAIAIRLSRFSPSRGEESTPLNFAVGGLYALMRAEELGYRSQKRYKGRGLEMWKRFLAHFYGAFDVRFIAEEFITAGEHIIAIGRIEGTTRKAAVPVDVPFVHVWTVREGYLQRSRAFNDTALLSQALAKG